MGFLKDLERRTLLRWKWLHTDTGRASWVHEWVHGTCRDPAQHFEARTPRECPCCDYKGLFVSAGRGRPREHYCPWCKSRPRSRFLALLLQRYGINLEAKRVLHFAPEWPIFNRLKHSPHYVGGDIRPRRNGNAIVDITAIAAPSASFDVIICNHVIEHVQDETAALSECRRVLTSDGIAFISLPIDMGRERTWFPPEDAPLTEVERICGRGHKRLYGRDFVDRLDMAGFGVAVEPPTGGELERYRLLPKDVFFVCRPKTPSMRIASS
jgi:SAM-dependent methyltransferase